MREEEKGRREREKRRRAREKRKGEEEKRRGEVKVKGRRGEGARGGGGRYI